MDIKKICIYCMQEKNEADGVCPHCGKDNNHYKRDPQHLPPMTPLNGKYLVGRALGQGGFGITYIALDTHLQVPVAIKELYLKDINRRNSGHTVTMTNSDMPLFEENRKRFLQEARVLAMFNEKDKDGIVSVRDHFEENGTAYIVMEYLDGITLKQYVKQKGKFSFEDAKRITLSVGSALTKVHQFGVIHKDVGPDNIMVLRDGNVKLLDFGAATNLYKRESGDIVSFKRGYAPPEQYRENGRLGPWTDVYALAATMYFCLTGVKPVESMKRDAGENLAPLSKYGVKLSGKFENVLMKAMALSPNERYHSVEEFLNAMLSGTRKPNKVLWGVIAALAVVAMVLVFLLGSGNKSPGNENDGNVSIQEPSSQETTEPPIQYQVGETIPMTLGTYMLESYSTPGLFMGVDSGFGDNGARLVLSEYSESNRNRIMITDAVAGDGFYNLQAAHTNSFLQANNTQELGAPLIQHVDMMDSGTEKWVFVYCGRENDRDVVILKNAANLVMAPQDGVMAAGTGLVLAEQNLKDNNQKWYLTWSEKNMDEPNVHVYTEGDLVESKSGVHTVASAYDGITMWAVSSHESLEEPEVIVWENVWDSTQHFRFELMEESRYRIYPINQPEGMNQCLEYDEETGRVFLRDVSDNVNQLFRVVYTGYNMYLIQAYNESVVGFEIGEDGSINGRAIVAKPYEEFSDSRQVKWLLGDVE